MTQLEPKLDTMQGSGMMLENLMCSTHKATNEAYRKGFDAICWHNASVSTDELEELNRLVSAGTQEK